MNPRITETRGWQAFKAGALAGFPEPEPPTERELEHMAELWGDE